LKRIYGTTEVVPFPVVVHSKSQCIGVVESHFSQKTREMGHPISWWFSLVIVLTKPKVKGDGQEYPSHTIKIRIDPRTGTAGSSPGFQPDSE
jgi:hypothetical protein